MGCRFRPGLRSQAGHQGVCEGVEEGQGQILGEVCAVTGWSREARGPAPGGGCQAPVGSQHLSPRGPLLLGAGVGLRGGCQRSG